MRYFLIGAMFYDKYTDYESFCRLCVMQSEIFPTKKEAEQFMQDQFFSKCVGLTSITEISKEDAETFEQ